MTLHDWIDLIRLFLPALATASALAIGCGIVGLFVMLRGEALMAIALPQVVAVGAGLALRWELQGWITFAPPLVFALAALVYLALAKRRGMGSWVLPCFYVAGLCISFLLIANRGQEVSTLQTMFTGTDVAVTPQRAMIVTPVLVVIGIACALLWRRWLLLAQAPAAAELAGLRLHRWDALFLGLLTLSTLVGTDCLGVVMVMVMLFLPAAAALPWARRIPAAVALCAGLGILFLIVGFYLSNTMFWPLSQTIGAVGFVGVVISHLAARIMG